MATDKITLRLLALTENEFTPGDVVYLKSGGPAMTVTDVCPDCGNVGVAWFNGDEANFDEFASECLDPADDGDVPDLDDYATGGVTRSWEDRVWTP